MGPPKKECILYWKNKSYFIKNDVGVVVGIQWVEDVRPEDCAEILGVDAEE